MRKAQAQSLAEAAMTSGDSRNRCAFNETRLPVGDSLFLEIPRRLDKRRDTITLVGWMEDHCLIVTAPQDDMLRKELESGEDVVLRTFNGCAAYAFRVSVMRPVRGPIHHLYLSYPSFVERVLIRSAARCRIELPTQLSIGETESACMLRNLSAKGALVETTATLQVGDCIDRVALSFELHGESLELQPKAAVRSIKPDANGEGFQVGLEFTELAASEKLAIAGFVTHQLLESRANAT
jgi:c-di-GMP-binding flagellar brake protein YcgR